MFYNSIIEISNIKPIVKLLFLQDTSKAINKLLLIIRANEKPQKTFTTI